MGELKKWRDEKWVRIGLDGSIKGECGTSKDKKNPDRCLPLSKAKSLSKAERAKTARKKKRGRGQFVPNTKEARVSRK
jgi:ribosomal protein L13E